MIKLEDYSERSNRISIHRLKGSISREFALTAEARSTIQAWLRKRGKAPGRLFPGYRGRGLSRFALHKLMRSYATRAGLPIDKRHFHCLKHTCATHLLDQDVEISKVQDHLGHADIRSTMVYAKVTEKQRVTVLEKLDRRPRLLKARAA